MHLKVWEYLKSLKMTPHIIWVSGRVEILVILLRPLKRVSVMLNGILQEKFKDLLFKLKADIFQKFHIYSYKNFGEKKSLQIHVQ